MESGEMTAYQIIMYAIRGAIRLQLMEIPARERMQAMIEASIRIFGKHNFH
jgi:hypothetical protein